MSDYSHLTTNEARSILQACVHGHDLRKALEIVLNQLDEAVKGECNLLAALQERWSDVDDITLIRLSATLKDPAIEALNKDKNAAASHTIKLTGENQLLQNKLKTADERAELFLAELRKLQGIEANNLGTDACLQILRAEDERDKYKAENALLVSVCDRLQAVATDVRLNGICKTVNELSLAHEEAMELLAQAQDPLINDGFNGLAEDIADHLEKYRK